MILSKMKKNKLLVTVATVYILLGLIQPDKAWQALSNSSYYLLEMAQIMPVIFLLTVSIEVLVPKEWILKHFGKDSGMLGNLLSLVLGSISAGPIYAAFPIGKALLAKGASVGNVVIILSAWAVIKVPMLANEAKFLGVQFMATRWVLTVVLILLMGYLMQKLVKEEDIPVEKVDADEDLSVEQDYCIGCGVCASMASEVFVMDQGKAHVIVGDLSEYTEIIKETADRCPAKAIRYRIESEGEIC